MAELRHEGSGRRHALASELTVGRSRKAELQLDDPRASALHARLSRRRGGWELTDLGSRNGTFLNERRLAAGERAQLSDGDRVAFGTPGQPWTLHDGGSATGSGRAGDGVTASSVHETRPASGGGRLDAAELHLTVSRDEEHVEVTVTHAGGATALPPSALHYLLLVVARQRLEDRVAGVPADAEGWLYADELCRRLRIEPSHLNVTIFRLRRQFERAGLEGARALIERRRTTGQLRLGPARVRIDAPGRAR